MEVTLFDACEFATERLLVKEWHAAAGDDWPAVDLGRLVADLMTEPVTRHLPDGWRGPFSKAEAEAWVRERDAESPTLLVIEQVSSRPIGLVVVFESVVEAPDDSAGGVDVRLGYVLDETVWGQGIATELLAGFADWCRRQEAITSISAGVAAANEASRRALERLGFTSVTNEQGGETEELTYRLAIVAT